MPVISGAADTLAVATLTLTHAQILSLPTDTSHVIVPAQGDGTFICPFYAVFSSHTAAGAYTNISVWDPTLPFNGAVYFAWDAPNNFATACSPCPGRALLGSTTPAVALSCPITDALLGLTGPVTTGQMNDGLAFGSAQATVNGYNNLGLYVVAGDTNGNWTGGNAANTLVATVAYAVAPL